MITPCTPCQRWQPTQNASLQRIDCMLLVVCSLFLASCSESSRQVDRAPISPKQGEGQNQQRVNIGGIKGNEGPVIITGSGNDFSGITINGKPLEISEGSGNAITNERKVVDFHSVTVMGAMNVSITPGDFSCSVTADDNLQEHITTQVEDKVLLIGSEGSYSSTSTVSVKLSLPELNSVNTTSSGDIYFEEFDSKILNVSTSSSGDVRFKSCQFEQLVARASSSGDIRGSGTAIELVAQSSGSGNIDLRELSATKVTASASSSGDVAVAPTKSLHATASSSGSIQYQKTPGLQVQKSANGSGTISAL